MPCFSVGTDLRNASCTRTELTSPLLVDEFCSNLNAIDTGGSSWWSPHAWTGDKRASAAWVESLGVALDLDFIEVISDQRQGKKAETRHTSPTSEDRASFDAFIRTGGLPVNVFHHTPRGARAVAVWREPCTDPDLQKAASLSIAQQIEDALLKTKIGVPREGQLREGQRGYQVDSAVVADLARLLYTPRCVVLGNQRRDTAVVISREQIDQHKWNAESAVKYAPLLTAEHAATRNVAPKISTDLREAIDRYNSDHARDWGPKGQPCPMCGTEGHGVSCFGPFGDGWWCFSNGHLDRCGVGHPGASSAGAGGDALDFDTWQAGLGTDIVSHLRATGYIEGRRSRPGTPPIEAYADLDWLVDRGDELDHSAALPAIAEPIGIIATPKTTPLALVHPGAEYATRTYVNTSASLVDILADPAMSDIVLDGKTLWRNDVGRIDMWGDLQIEDNDCIQIKVNIENNLSEITGKGKIKPLSFSTEKMHECISLVCSKNRKNVLKDWLDTLVWDGVGRWREIVIDMFGVPDDRIGISAMMLRRWAISAVARAYQPGCKVDTVMVLVGEQKKFKSTFFNVLGGQWYADTSPDITNKDFWKILSKYWIYELAEMEVLTRKREAEAIKAFISKQIDVLRPAYGRRDISLPRNWVAGGTTNSQEFLTDTTGNRRFWPIEVNKRIDILHIKEIRDQFWAQAVADYKAGVQWWLDDDEEIEIVDIHEEHSVIDPWSDVISRWLVEDKKRMSSDPLTVSRIMDSCLIIENPKKTGADAKRIANILRQLGFKRTKLTAEGPWQYVRQR